MRRIACLALFVVVPVLGVAQGAPPPPPPDLTAPQAPPPAGAQAADEPPPPPETTPPPPGASTEPAPAPPGQWVDTAQYGWVWIPYAQAYTYIPPDPQMFPEQYVYYPVYGWRWVVAPWVYGYGPAPVWGAQGPRLFVWYAHPWFRVGGYWGWGGYRGWGHYRGWIGPRTWGPHGWASAPPYYRSGVPAHRAAPAIHAAPPRRGTERQHHSAKPHGGEHHER